jgi:hypothetical protein
MAALERIPPQLEPPREEPSESPESPAPTETYRRRRRPSGGHRAPLVGVLAIGRIAPVQYRQAPRTRRRASNGYYQV